MCDYLFYYGEELRCSPLGHFFRVPIAREHSLVVNAFITGPVWRRRWHKEAPLELCSAWHGPSYAADPDQYTLSTTDHAPHLHQWSTEINRYYPRMRLSRTQLMGRHRARQIMETEPGKREKALSSACWLEIYCNFICSLFSSGIPFHFTRRGRICGCRN